MLGIFLDTETTGLDSTTHQPIEIAFQIVDLVDGREVDSYQSAIKIDWSDWNNRDPKSIEINGFSWQEVEAGKPPALVQEEIIHLFSKVGIKRGEAFFICQNPSFDRGFFNRLIPVQIQMQLDWPYHWLDLASMYWAARVIKSHSEGAESLRKVPVSKNDIALYLGLPEERNPHRAMNGVRHLMQCYSALFTGFSE